MKKLISVEEAVAKVKDGMTVMIGGFLSNGHLTQSLTLWLNRK